MTPTHLEALLENLLAAQVVTLSNQLDQAARAKGQVRSGPDGYMREAAEMIAKNHGRAIALLEEAKSR